MSYQDFSGLGTRGTITAMGLAQGLVAEDVDLKKIRNKTQPQCYKLPVPRINRRNTTQQKKWNMTSSL